MLYTDTYVMHCIKFIYKQNNSERFVNYNNNMTNDLTYPQLSLYVLGVCVCVCVLSMICMYICVVVVCMFDVTITAQLKVFLSLLILLLRT